MAPTVFHRVAERTARRARLVWGVRLAIVGIVLLAVALVAATWCIIRLVFGTPEATVVAASAVVVFVVVWVLLPLSVGRTSRHSRRAVGHALREEQLELDGSVVLGRHHDRSAGNADPVVGEHDVERTDDDDVVVDELRLDRDRHRRRHAVNRQLTGRRAC